MHHHTLADRHKAVLSVLRASGIDRLIACSNGHHMIDLANPVAHLTGFRSIGPALLTLDSDGAMALAVAGADEAERASSLPLPVADAGADPAHLPGAVHRPAERVATIGLEDMPRRLAATIASRLPDDAPALDGAIYAATGRKTDDEIAHARRATRIAEAGWRHMLEIARPGLRECELAVAVNLHMRALGANDSFLMLNCGPRADAVMPSSERPIEAGDLLLTELSPAVEGQFTQICRTASIGAPKPDVPEKYALLIEAMREGIACAKPGARMGDVCMTIDDNLSARGYAKFSRPPFIRRRGHGLGGSSVYPGDVSVDNATVLEPGMMFMVHPNQFLPETGYMMCGEPVLVTPQGCEVLTARQAELAVVPVKGARP